MSKIIYGYGPLPPKSDGKKIQGPKTKGGVFYPKQQFPQGPKTKEGYFYPKKESVKRPQGPLTKSGEFYTKETLTKQGYISKLESQKESIIPTGRYKIDNSGRTFFGSYIISEFINPQISQAKRLPDNVIIKRDGSVYRVESPKKKEIPDYDASPLGLVSWITSPYAVEYAWESIAGPRTFEERFAPETKRMREIRNLAEYEFRQKMGEGDYGYFAKRIITSPLVVVPLTHYAFKGLGLAVKLIKPAISKIPDVVSSMYNKFPKLLNTQVTETGKVITTRSSKFLSDLGHTSLWKNMEGWSTGYLSRVKTYPLISRQSIKGLGYIERYRGFFGKTEWLPSRMIPSKLEFGAGITHTPYGLESSAYSQQIFRRGLSIQRQFLSYSETTKLPTSFGNLSTARTDLWKGFIKPESAISPLERSLIADTGGWVRQSLGADFVLKTGGNIKMGFFSDTFGSQKLVPSISVNAFRGGMGTGGFTGTSISLGRTSSLLSGLKIGSIPTLGFGFIASSRLNQMERQSMRSLQVSNLGSMDLQGIGLANIGGQLQRQDTLSRQLQKSISMSLGISKAKFPSIASNIPKTVFSIPKAPKIYIPKTDSYFGNAKNVFSEDLLFGKGWRGRIWL